MAAVVPLQFGVDGYPCEIATGDTIAAGFLGSHTHDHGADLTGLGDDDHTQYALLAGRSGGQTIHLSSLTGEGGYIRANAVDGVGTNEFQFVQDGPGQVSWSLTGKQLGFSYDLDNFCAFDAVGPGDDYSAGAGFQVATGSWSVDEKFAVLNLSPDGTWVQIGAGDQIGALWNWLYIDQDHVHLSTRSLATNTVRGAVGIPSCAGTPTASLTGTVVNGYYLLVDRTNHKLYGQLSGGSWRILGTTSASDLDSGTLALARGGTGANLSATGGSNQFLKQTSAGGVVTVGTISGSELPWSGAANQLGLWTGTNTLTASGSNLTYASNQLISRNASAGVVTPLSIVNDGASSVGAVNDGVQMSHSMRDSSGGGVTTASWRSTITDATPSSVDTKIEHRHLRDGTQRVYYRYHATRDWHEFLVGAETLAFAINADRIISRRIARCSSNRATTSTSLVDITDMSLPLLANTNYRFEFYANVNSTTSAGGTFAVQFSASGATVEAQIDASTTGVTAGIRERINALNTSTTAVITLNGNGVVKIVGHISVGANAGDLTIRYSKVTSGTLTVFAGATLLAEGIL